MRHRGLFLHLFWLGILVFTAISCSRGGLGSSFGLSIPGRDQGGLASEDTLKKSIMIVHVDGRSPKRQEVTYRPGEVPRGQDLSVDLSNVPLGLSYFIQFLAVYDNSLTGGLKVTYGFAQGVVQRQNDIEITAQNVSYSDVMVRVAGRYLTATNSGPTGTINATYIPDLGHPPIVFDQFTIQDGWFEIQAPDAFLGAFQFSVGGDTLFSNLRPTNPQLSSFGPKLLKIKKPLSFHLESGQVKPTPEADLLIGFWGQVSAENICFLDVQEVISGEFRDGNLMSPLEYKAQNPQPVQVRPVAGGVAGTSCSSKFDHQRVSSAQPYLPR